MAVVILTMFICSFPVSAANPTISVGTSSYKVSVGDVVAVSVSLSENSGLGTLVFDLNYNASEFEYVEGSAAATSLFNEGIVNPHFATGKVRYAAAATGVENNGGVLFSLKFKVLKTGGTISLSNVEATDTNDNNVTVSKTSVNFTCAHKDMKWTVEKAATCSAEGTEKGTCSCGYTTTRSISKSEHKFANPTVVKQPTCTETGLSRGDCSVCGAKGAEEVIKAKGHNYTDWVVTKQPTLITKGEKERTCLTCGDKKTQVIATTEVEAPTTTAPAETESTESLFPTEETTEEELVITTQPIQNYYEIETEPQTEPSGGLFGAGLEGSDTAVLIVIVLAVLVVIVLAVYILLIVQRKKK